MKTLIINFMLMLIVIQSTSAQIETVSPESIPDSLTADWVIQFLESPILRNQDFKKIDSVLYLTNIFESSLPEKGYEKAIKKAVQQKNWSWAGEFEHRLAKIHYEFDKLILAKKHGQLSLQYFEKAKDDLGKANLFGTLRAIYVLLYDYEKAFNYCYEALKIFERENDKAGQAMILEDLGSLLTHQKKFDEAIKTLERALSIAKEIKDTNIEGLIYVKLGVIYKKMENWDRALDYITQSLSLCEGYPSYHKFMHLSDRYTIRASIYQMKGLFEIALVDYLSAKKMTSKINNTQIGLINTALGESYLLQEDYEKALDYFKSTKQEIEESDTYLPYDMMVPIEENLSKAYAGLGQFEKAYQHVSNHAIIMDSIFNINNNKQINELREIYETEKKEAAISKLENESKIRNQFLWLTSFLLLLSIVLGYMLWRDNRFKKEMNAQLLKQNNTISQQSEQNKILLKEIHHRVKNNLQIISSLLNFQSRAINDKLVKTALLDSQSRVQSMSLIHQKLYREQQLAAVEMKSYLGNLAESLIDAYADEEVVNVQIDMDTFELDVDYALPLGLIANELVTNSLKHAFPNKRKGSITIQLKQQENDLVLSIGDNGIGQSTPKIQNTNDGFGSELLEMLTLQLKGKIVQSSISGFQTQFRFPYQKAA